MKKINISTPKYPNQFTFVDKENFEWLNQWKWRTHSKGYAIRMAGGRKNAHVIYMHRLINDTPDGFETDHINRNKLDNRKKNLRSVNRFENKMNTGLWKHNTSGYKGVTWNRQIGKWVAQIGLNNKNIVLGCFNDIKEASLARVEAERRVFL